MYTTSDLVGRMTKRFGGMRPTMDCRSCQRILISMDASTLYGFPPKVIWLWTGNCSTERIASLLQFQRSFHRGIRKQRKRFSACAALAKYGWGGAAFQELF